MKMQSLVSEIMTNGILEHDHEQLAVLLHILETALSSNDPDQGFAELDLFWARLAMHIRAEHLCLFPAILNAPQELFEQSSLPTYEEAETMIENLRADHNFFMDELAKAIKTFREIRATPEGESGIAEKLGTIRTRVGAVSRRLELHNVAEEDRLYKWPELVLSASNLADLNATMKRELENLPQRLQ